MTICTFFLLFPKTRTGYQVPTFKFETQFFLFFVFIFKKKIYFLPVHIFFEEKVEKKRRIVAKNLF